MPGTGREKKSDLANWLRSFLVPPHVPTAEEELVSEEEHEKEHERLTVCLPRLEKVSRKYHTVPYSPKFTKHQKRGMPISHISPESSAPGAYTKNCR